MLMKLKYLVFLLLISVSPFLNAKNLNGVFVDFSELEKVKVEIGNNNPNYLPAYKSLLEKADLALTEGPFSVMDKKRIPPSGDKHDYLSGGPYWWPDPKKPNGLPYIRRDGKVNPEMRGENVDPPAKIKMMNNLNILAWAYYFSEEKKYARKAVELLKTWFLDEATRMNPNLNFAQGIPGRVEGRGIGIIDWREIYKIITPIEILSNEKLLGKKTERGLSGWFEAYYEWLHTHEYGKFEDDYFNNHGTWFDMQAVGIALFLGKNDAARERLEGKTKKRISKQIEPDGSQPHELGRTKSLSYSVMNLRGFCILADMGRKIGIDLWGFETTDGRGIEKAFEFLLPVATGEQSWKYQQISGMEDALHSLQINFRMAAHATGKPKYLEVARTMPVPFYDLEALIYPIGF